MQDLNDKITGNTLTAAEWNEVPSELQNIIEAWGQVLSTGDLDQLGKGVAAYAAAGDFYTGGGAADVYTATKLAGIQAPPDYATGMLVRFRAPAANTGAATVNVNALGVKNITREDGNALNANDIVITRDAWMYYDGTDFLLTNSSSGDITPVSSAAPSEATGVMTWTDDTTVTLKPGTGDNIVINVDGARLTRNTDLIFILGDFGVGGSVLDTGSEASSTPYYLYINNNAGVMEPVISASAPVDIGGVKPGYHPSRTDERCIGSFWNNVSEDITPFYMIGNELRFQTHDADLEHDLTESASTSWVNLPMNIPLSASAVSISASAKWGAVGNGMVCWGVDGATGTLTSANMDPTAAGFEFAILYAASTGSNDGNGYSVQGSIPIDDRTNPAVSYGITRNLSSDHFMIVNGYTDLWAPK